RVASGRAPGTFLMPSCRSCCSVWRHAWRRSSAASIARWSGRAASCCSRVSRAHLPAGRRACDRLAMAQVRRVVKEEAWNVLHPPALLRVGVAFLLGIVTGSIALGWMRWEFAALVGWDTIALTVLIMVWSQIWTFDCERTAALSRREDETRATAGLLELSAATVSLVGVFYALQQASELAGLTRVAFTAAAMLTIVLSWILVNTV